MPPVPKRTDISSVLIIGAGPIVIGQACEFDYSGAQACKALKDEGYRVILVNSNPATIMTDPAMADATYVEPVEWRTVAKIIEVERPHALLPTMGGQTALNCALDLVREGVLEKFGVELIGASQDAIDKAEDRERFDQAMKRIGLECPRSAIAHSMEEALQVQGQLGFPCIIRPSFTLGGSGGGVAYNQEEFEEICARGLDLSPTHELLIDESLLGWKEFEMEVVRDKHDNCIIVCSIENFDPMGVHTGDSITVAPAQTLTDKEYQLLRNASIAVLREIGVETGGSNVQFAINPDDGRMVVIEMNPRVSRSSALASKATGFPIAKVAAKLAVGYTLDELINDITGVTPASFEPSIDYVVTKLPRFTFEKFQLADARLTTQMKSVGEVMAIGRTFQESLQKALRGLETGMNGLDPMADLRSDEGAGDPPTRAFHARGRPHPLRGGRVPIRHVGRRGPRAVRDRPLVPGRDRRSGGHRAARSKVGRWQSSTGIGSTSSSARVSPMRASPISSAYGRTTCGPIGLRLDVRPVYRRVDTCAAEFPAATAYLYSTYEEECEAEPSSRRKIMVLGGGPNRIGQGIEFDYCCVHAALAMREDGFETIMVNCNPETVSTDYDTSDRLYFEPVTLEDVLAIVAVEQAGGRHRAVRRADAAEARGATRARGGAHHRHEPRRHRPGRGPGAIPGSDRHPGPAPAEQPHCRGRGDRHRGRAGHRLSHRGAAVLRAGRPGHGDRLQRRGAEALSARCGGGVQPVARCCSTASSTRRWRWTWMRSGTAATWSSAPSCSTSSRPACTPAIPRVRCRLITSPRAVQDRIREQVKAMALELGVVGLMNVQLAVQDEEIFVLEVNPRASRTVPFVSKCIGASLAKVAARCMAGVSLAEQGFTREIIPTHVNVKESVFPFSKFPGVDPILGPEMKSTGEVMGVGDSFGEAFAKASLGAGVILPQSGRASSPSRIPTRRAWWPSAASWWTSASGWWPPAARLACSPMPASSVSSSTRWLQGRPHVVDMLKNEQIDLIVNTTEGHQSIRDSAVIRRLALQNKVCYTTTLTGGEAFAIAIRYSRENGDVKVRRLQDLYEAATS